MANTAHVVSDIKFKWIEKLDEDLLTARCNFKTIIKFHNKDFKADKHYQYEVVQKELVRINES